MPNRPRTISTVTFYLELLKRVPKEPSQTTSSELLSSLKDIEPNLERRKLERALKELSTEGFLVRNESSIPYGYSTPTGSPSFAISQMQQLDALFFMLAEKHLKDVMPAQLLNALEPFFAHARNEFRLSLGANVARDWLKKMAIVSPTLDFIPPDIDTGILSTITRGLYEDRLLQVEYKNQEGKVNEYFLMPLGLVQQTPFIYLVACYESNPDSQYTFAIHRFRSARETTIPFKRPKFDLQQYCREARHMFGEGQQVEIEFFITKYEGRRLEDSPLSIDQEITQVGDEYHVRATVYESLRLDHYLNSISNEIRDLKKTKVGESSEAT